MAKISDKDLLKALKNDPELLKQVQASAKEAKKNDSDSKKYDKNGKVLKVGESEFGKRYRYRWTDPNGKRQQVYADTLDDLRRKERQIQKDLEEGIQTNEADSITVKMVWDKFIQNKKNTVKYKTYLSYCTTYNTHIKDALGDRKIRSFKYSDIVAFYLDIIETQNCSVSLITHVHNLMNAMFKMCIKDQYILVNPCDGALTEVKKSCKKVKKKEAFTLDQQRNFLKFIASSENDSRYLQLVTVFLTTGMRVSELCGLTWDHVDFEKNEIHVEYQINHIKEDGDEKATWHIETPKSNDSNRIIPMLTETRLALMQVKDIQNQFGLKSASFTDVIDHKKVTLSGFCFLNANGNPYDYHNINRMLKRVTSNYNKDEEAKAKEENRDPVYIDPFGTHKFRHTFSTRCAEMEMNMKVQQEIMGHSDIRTTMNIYTDAQTDKIHEEIEKLDSRYKLS